MQLARAQQGLGQQGQQARGQQALVEQALGQQVLGLQVLGLQAQGLEGSWVQAWVHQKALLHDAHQPLPAQVQQGALGLNAAVTPLQQLQQRQKLEPQLGLVMLWMLNESAAVPP